MSYVYYDAAAKKIHIADHEVDDAGDYIGELAEQLDAKSPYAKFIVSSLMRNAGHNVSGLTIVAYTPPTPGNQET